jgi:hypothetical protein
MKTFSEWLVENHPEMIDEATFGPTARRFGMAALLAAGGLGMTGRANAADAKNPVKQSEEAEEEDHDEDFIAGDSDDDAEIRKEKEYMLRKAAQLKTTTTRQNGVVVSRGSGHMVGGKVVGPSQQVINKGVQKATSQTPKKFNPTRKLPELKNGAAQSPDFKGGFE